MSGPCANWDVLQASTAAWAVDLALGARQAMRGPGAMVGRGESAAPSELFLGPGSESTESSVVVVCKHVSSPFSHKGANARGALATLMTARGATWRRGGGEQSVSVVGMWGKRAHVATSLAVVCQSGLLHLTTQSFQPSLSPLPQLTEVTYVSPNQGW